MELNEQYAAVWIQTLRFHSLRSYFPSFFLSSLCAACILEFIMKLGLPDYTSHKIFLIKAAKIKPGLEVWGLGEGDEVGQEEEQQPEEQKHRETAFFFFFFLCIQQIPEILGSLQQYTGRI